MKGENSQLLLLPFRRVARCHPLSPWSNKNAFIIQLHEIKIKTRPLSLLKASRQPMRLSLLLLLFSSQDQSTKMSSRGNNENK